MVFPGSDFLCQLPHTPCEVAGLVQPANFLSSYFLWPPHPLCALSLCFFSHTEVTSAFLKLWWVSGWKITATVGRTQCPFPIMHKLGHLVLFGSFLAHSICMLGVHSLCSQLEDKHGYLITLQIRAQKHFAWPKSTAGWRWLWCPQYFREAVGKVFLLISLPLRGYPKGTFYNLKMNSGLK